MVEEAAEVIKVEGDVAWVQAIQKTACGSCQAQKGCGHSLLAKVGQKKIELPVATNDVHAEVGDQVVIGVPEQAILRSSLLMYGLPLATMMLVALLASLLEIPEGPSVIASFIALIFGFVLVNIRSKQMNFAQWQPRLLRKVSIEQSLIPMCDATEV